MDNYFEMLINTNSILLYKDYVINNLAKIKNEESSILLKNIVDSIEIINPSLYESLIRILKNRNLIKQVEITSWKDFPKEIFSKPETLKIIMDVVAFIILGILYFVLTGKLP